MALAAVLNLIFVTKISNLKGVAMKLLSFFVFVNIIWAFLLYRTHTTVSYLRAEVKRNKLIYNQDIAALEILLKNRVTKIEVIDIFSKVPPPFSYFEKPTENGIGASHLFFYFKDNQLESIQKYDFAEK